MMNKELYDKVCKIVNEFNRNSSTIQMSAFRIEPENYVIVEVYYDVTSYMTRNEHCAVIFSGTDYRDFYNQFTAFEQGYMIGRKAD